MRLTYGKCIITDANECPNDKLCLQGCFYKPNILLFNKSFNEITNISN